MKLRVYFKVLALPSHKIAPLPSAVSLQSSSSSLWCLLQLQIHFVLMKIKFSFFLSRWAFKWGEKIVTMIAGGKMSGKSSSNFYLVVFRFPSLILMISFLRSLNSILFDEGSFDDEIIFWTSLLNEHPQATCLKCVFLTDL